MTSFYTNEELMQLGFASVGSHVLLSKKASIYGAQNISLGNHVRIDDFCILSGTICTGNYVHIAAYTALYGGKSGITIEDFANISARNCIYAVNDDYSGAGLSNPLIPDAFKHVHHAPVLIGRHVIIGCGCVILPGAILREGAVLGALSFLSGSCDSFGIYAGIPAKKIKARAQDLLEQEMLFLQEEDDEIG